MVSIKPVLEIDDVDFSDILKEIHFKITHVKRNGPNGGMMKDGSMTVDVLAWKTILNFSTKGTTPENMAAFVAALLKDYVKVKYIGTDNQEHTGTFIPADSIEVPVGYFKDGAIGFYNSTSITLTER